MNERAREVDARLNCFIALADEPPPAGEGPLAGLAYAYKDVFADGGVPPSAGLAEPPVALTGKATVLERADAAGAVAVGRLNLDPLAYSTTGLNPIHGDVRNPWDPARIAGGSSSGAAAAVAAGAVDFALGTDTGGSIRIPAAFCGVTGLKPTYGRIPRSGCVPLSYSQDTVGILARSALEVARVLEQLAGPDGRDPSSIAAPRPISSEPRAQGVRIGFDPRRNDRAVEMALGALEGLGALVVEVDLALLDRLDAAATVLTWAEVSSAYGRQAATFPPNVRVRLEAAARIGGAQYAHALRYRGRALHEVLGGPLAAADVLALPVVAGPPPETAALADPQAAAATSLANLRLNRPLNYAGLPALALPVGFSNGLPTGVQLAARPWAETTLLACAAAYQQTTDWHLRAPPEGV